MVKRDSEVLRLNYSYQMSLSFKSIYIYGSVSWRKLKYINPFKQQRLWNLLNTSHIIWELCPRVKKITADTEVASPFTTAFSCCFSFFSPTHILEDLKIWAHINDHTPCFCWSVFLTSSKQFPTTFFFALMQFPVWNRSGLSYGMFLNLPECMFMGGSKPNTFKENSAWARSDLCHFTTVRHAWACYLVLFGNLVRVVNADLFFIQKYWLI